MRWLRLYLRSRRVPRAATVATATTALVWTLWLAGTDAPVVSDRLTSLTVLLAVAAFTAPLGGADDDLDRAAAVNWPARRAGHLLLTAAAIAALLLSTTVTGARFAPPALVLRDTVGLLGLTAACTALFGVSRSWIVPVTWTLLTALPLVGPSPSLRMQVVGWLVQPPGTTTATVCAAVLAVAGLVTYSLRGCPSRPATETAPDH